VYPRTLTSGDVVAFLATLPSGERPCVVVLDNAGIHISKQVRRALPSLHRLGLSLFYLPAYAPELNDVEAVFGVIKGYELPERSYVTLQGLLAAVRHAFLRYRRRLNRKR
jgi:transposase